MRSSFMVLTKPESSSYSFLLRGSCYYETSSEFNYLYLLSFQGVICTRQEKSSKLPIVRSSLNNSFSVEKSCTRVEGSPRTKISATMECITVYMIVEICTIPYRCIPYLCDGCWSHIRCIVLVQFLKILEVSRRNSCLKCGKLVQWRNTIFVNPH